MLNSKIFTVTFLILLALTVSVASADERSTLLRYGTPIVESEYCLPGSEFTVRGITTGHDIQETKDILGEPVGGYLGTDWPTYKFDTLEIGTCYNHMTWIKTQNSQDKTPSGVHVGLSREEVFSILGVDYLQKNHSDTFNASDHCNENLSQCYFQHCNAMGTFMTFKFNNDGMLIEIKMGGDCT
ncbi:MAG: hypothetical protein C0623_13495 [Desulfuromonas sp.]|nr:MAG: hypothetical protein C0623_13495 [Desulfuromonas sp.]